MGIQYQALHTMSSFLIARDNILSENNVFKIKVAI